MVLAIGLAIAGVFLVVIGGGAWRVQLGVLLGLWGGLTALFVQLDTRRRTPPADSDLSALELAARRDYELNLAKGRELELRRNFEIELERHVAGRREYELQLEVMLRREMERALRDELSELKTEVAGLRSDLSEKINGQLLLERIETTRVFGSDLEALQAEVRRLSGSHDVLASPAFTIAPAVIEGTVVDDRSGAKDPSSARPGPGDSAGSTAHPDPVPSDTPADTPNPADTANTANSGPAAPSVPTIDYPSAADYQVHPAPSATNPVQPTQPPPIPPTPATPPVPPAMASAVTSATPPAPPASSAPAVPTAPVAAPAPPAGSSDDPFAGMPRLGAFVDEPIEVEADEAGPAEDTPDSGPGSAPPAAAAGVEPSYVGRRRSGPDANGDAAPGGRRRRADNDADDVLSRLLGR
jgi:hypothetical protein